MHCYIFFGGAVFTRPLLYTTGRSVTGICKFPALREGLTSSLATNFYGKKEPFRSWPISANKLEEVASASDTSV